MALLSNIVARLKTLVPPVSGSPTDAEYENIVKRAVDIFSVDTERPTETSFSITSGVDAYTLPDDFLSFIAFKRADTYDQRPHHNWPNEIYDQRGLTLTIHPTPDETEDRILRYGWRHILDESDEYPYLDDRLVDIVLLKAQANALRYGSIAKAAAAGNVTEYTEGEVRVKIDRKSAAGTMVAQAAMLDVQYGEAVVKLNYSYSG